MAAPKSRVQAGYGVRQFLAAGAAAGDVTVTGIKTTDKIESVLVFGLTEGTPNTFSGIADLTSEFTITADDTINNVGGTSTAAKLVSVVVTRAPAGG